MEFWGVSGSEKREGRFEMGGVVIIIEGSE